MITTTGQTTSESSTETSLPQRITVSTVEDRLIFQTPALELTFSAKTGQWLTWHDRKAEQNVTVGEESAGDMIIGSDGEEHRPPPRRIPYYEGADTASDPGRYVRHSFMDDGTACTLHIYVEYDGWLVTHSYRVEPYGSLVEHSLELAPAAKSGVDKEETRLRGFSTLSRIKLNNPEEWKLMLPGWDGQLAEQPLAALADRDKPLTTIDVPFIGIGLVGLRHAASDNNIMLFPFSWIDAVDVSLSLDGDFLEVRYDIKAAARMDAGQSLRYGGLHAQQYTGTWDEALQSFQAFYTSKALHTPTDRPAWTQRAAIYEAHIGTAVFRDDFIYAPYPEITDLIADLPRVRSLGFDVIQLMPRQPYPCYAVHDYYDVSTSYGDEAQLRELVSTAHSLGVRVILDVIMHGVMDQEVINEVEYSARTIDDMHWPELRQTVIDFAPYWRAGSYPRHPLAEAHPDWFMQTEEGEIAAIYTKAFDLANPGLQEYFIEAMEYLVRTLEVDGFRFDAPNWNVFPDWNPDRPYRASYSTFASVDLFRKARVRLHALKPDMLFYTESSGPLFRESMDLNYNYDEHWLIPAVMEGRIDARQMGEWFDGRYKALPTGFVTAHHVDSHDSFWWPKPGQKWRREQFGQPATSALVAVLGLIDGAFMNYVGGEVGQEEFLAHILKLRHTLPALSEGDCSYRTVECDNGSIFTALRSSADSQAVVAVNLSDKEVECNITLPFAASAATVLDALNDETVSDDAVQMSEGQCTIALAFQPYQAGLLTFQVTK